MKKIFFSDNVKWTCKKLQKIISGDVKADVKQQQIKELVAYLVTFYKKYLQNIKYNEKQAWHFSIILFGIPSSLILSTNNRGSVVYT